MENWISPLLSLFHPSFFSCMYGTIHPSCFSISPVFSCLFLLQSQLTLYSFVSSILSRHLWGLRSSYLLYFLLFSTASNLLLSLLTYARFPSLIFKPMHASLFSSLTPVVHSPPPQPSNPCPSLHKTLLMDPMSAEYQSKPHNCTVASCLSLLKRLTLLCMKKMGKEKK